MSVAAASSETTGAAHGQQSLQSSGLRRAAAQPPLDPFFLHSPTPTSAVLTIHMLSELSLSG